MDNKKRIVVATHNKHKVEEIQAILDIDGWELVGLDGLGISDEPVEDADSFEGNARIKARFAHEKTGLAALADDSGIVVDALGGAPGVLSARYAGPNASDSDNNAKLLVSLKGLPSEERSAYFKCVMVFIDEDGSETVAEGTVDGQIAFTPRGSNGFGYDPLFCLTAYEYKRTMAELDASEKNTLSHRYNALRKLKDALSPTPQVGDPAPAATLADDRGRSSLQGRPHRAAATSSSRHPAPVPSHRPACLAEPNVAGPTPSPLCRPACLAEPNVAGPTPSLDKPAQIVAFDFDGTLIDASSPVKLITRLNRNRVMPRRKVFLSLLWGLWYKLGIERDQRKPRRYIFASFRHSHVSDANAIMKNLYHEELRNYLRPQALAAVEEHRRQGAHLIVVSASFEPIIEELCKELDIRDFICTRMEINEDAYTGETLTEPPESEQKLIQFTQWANDKFGEHGWVLTYAYGDHHSDVPLMETALHPVAIDPDKKLEKIAQQRGWTIHMWPLELIAGGSNEESS